MPCIPVEVYRVMIIVFLTRRCSKKTYQTTRRDIPEDNSPNFQKSLRFRCSGIWRRVNWQIYFSVSQDVVASMFRVVFDMSERSSNRSANKPRICLSPEFFKKFESLKKILLQEIIFFFLEKVWLPALPMSTKQQICYGVTHFSAFFLFFFFYSLCVEFQLNGHELVWGL